MLRSALLTGLLLICPFAANAASSVPLFNGKDLTGWVNVNCAPETWSVVDGMIHCTGKPTGALRTTQQYENFILELEWRHLSAGGNSGVFIWGSPIAAPGVPFLRAIEVQVLDNAFNVPGKKQWYTTHGDVFPIHGATMSPFGRHNGMRSFPSEERSHSSPEWNHYRVVCDHGTIRLSVNGKEVSGGENCNYRKGYIGLESEGGPIDFRDIRVEELPSSHTPPDLTAPLDAGWRSLFTGLDLRGWLTNSPAAAEWSVRDEVLVAPSSAIPAAVLWTEQAFGHVEFTVDYKLSKSGAAPGAGIHVRRAAQDLPVQIPETKTPTDGWVRLTIEFGGDRATVRAGQGQGESTDLSGGPSEFGHLGLSGGEGIHFRNVYVRDL